VTSYFVYYRVDPARLDELRAAVERMFATLEQATGIRGRWMRRRDESTTYMEVYEGVVDEREFEALLEREARGLGVERHVERFVCA
jgi:hypothetical protein